MLHSPYPHAEIVSIDTSEAEKLPGVIGVMTYKNAPDWKTGVPSHRPVMSQHLRFVGDPVAAVAAETPQIAEEALELIKVEYKELTPVYDVEDAIKDGAPEVYRAEDNIESKGYHYDHNCLPPGSWFEGDDPPFYKIQEGDVAKGFGGRQGCLYLDLPRRSGEPLCGCRLGGRNPCKRVGFLSGPQHGVPSAGLYHWRPYQCHHPQRGRQLRQ